MDKFKTFLNYGLIFLGTFLILSMIQNGSTPDPILSQGDLGIKTNKAEYAIGKEVKVTLQNNTQENIVIEAACPDTPFTVLKYSSEGYQAVESDLERDCEFIEDITINPGAESQVSLKNYAYSLLGETGRYVIEFGEYRSPEFLIDEPGLITRLWRNIVYNPILNALVAIILYMPGHHLGLAIILLTLFIRTLLLAPSAKAIRAQRGMQEIQPKLEALKKKYSDDQARLAQETMMLWKKHNVSPVSSCLPMLIQFPILIALFYVIQNGLSADKSVLIYDFLPSFSLTNIDTSFFMFDLSERSLIVFPLVIGSLQFMQMQFMTAKRKKKGDVGNLPKEVETANKMMKYVMPLMIAFFTTQLPAAVGLYWGTSTLYGIIQQLVLNNKSSSAKTVAEDEVKVRVINKSK